MTGRGWSARFRSPSRLTAEPGSKAGRRGWRASTPVFCSWGSALAKLAPSGLRVSIDRGVAGAPEKPTRLVGLRVIGRERPGIVRDVAQALARLDVNIEEFASGLEGEPFTGLEMFHATARLNVPEGLALEDLRGALEKLAAEIVVDLTVGEDDRRP
jgi:glycine cleavage system regulatory protein